MSQLRRWKKFARDQAEEAGRILDLTLPACEALRGKSPAEQLETMRLDSHCKDLHDLLRLHRKALLIPDHGLAYVSFALRLCYYAVVKAENARTNQ